MRLHISLKRSQEQTDGHDVDVRCSARRAARGSSTGRRVPRRHRLQHRAPHPVRQALPPLYFCNILHRYLAGLVTFIMKMLFPSPYKASAPVVWMALADALPVASNQPIYYQHLWQAVCLPPRLLLPTFPYLIWNRNPLRPTPWTQRTARECIRI